MKELQDFLRGHEVEFDTKPPQAQLDAARQNAAAEKEPPKGIYRTSRRLLNGMHLVSFPGSKALTWE